ncbi:MAG: HI0074 family nucleotidyltransferase substrate-binding subunit [Roseobacter sp.]
MSGHKLKDSFSNLQKAVANLESALQIPRDRELVFEGTIHRYEVMIELMWKTMQRALKYEGISAKVPRETLVAAFKAGWINDEKLWLDMVGYRNTTSYGPCCADRLLTDIEAADLI